MRILQANKFYYPKGGADKYFIELTEALNLSGYETAVFAMKDSRNLKTPYAKYFVSKIEFNHGNLLDKIRIPGRMIYSLAAKRKFARELNDFKPDIVHVHNIYHQLSPAILEAAKEKGIPVIMHLHDYKLVCPNYRLFTKNRVCRRCLDEKSFSPCIKNNCYESHSASFLAALEMTIHHKWLHIYEKNIDLLIAPSEFMRRLVVDSGWPEDKIITIYNPAPKTSLTAVQISAQYKKEGDHLLYFGRLVSEKGITDLIRAAKSAGWKNAKELRIAGDGPEEINIRKKFAAEIKSGRLKLLGRLSGSSLQKEIAAARAIVFPSIWPENMPLALLESLAQGKIVIASRIGGLPEIIKDRKNGFLFEAGDMMGLERTIGIVFRSDQKTLIKIKSEAVKSAQKLDPDDHLKSILKIYSKLAKKSE